MIQIIQISHHSGTISRQSTKCVTSSGIPVLSKCLLQDHPSNARKNIDKLLVKKASLKGQSHIPVLEHKMCCLNCNTSNPTEISNTKCNLQGPPDHSIKKDTDSYVTH